MMTSTLPSQTPPPRPPRHGPESPGAAPQDPGPAPAGVLEPGRRLTPSAERDRALRLVITVLGGAFVTLLLASLVTLSVTGWAVGRDYDEVPATTDLGTPASLTLSSQVANVRILRSADAEEVSVALVEGDATRLPPPQDMVRARVDQHGTAEAPVLEVHQPDRFQPVPWQTDVRDLLVVVPEGHQLALDLRSSIGDVRAEGSFSDLTVDARVGEVRLSALQVDGDLTVSSSIGDVDVELESPAPGTVDVTSSVGDVELRLPADAGGDVSVRTELGSADVAAPGTGRWDVEARSDVGEARVDPNLTRADGPSIGTLTVVSEVGEVTVTR